MKTARVWSSAVFVGCPECDELIESPDGSFIHDVMNQIHSKTDRCPSCGCRFRLPGDYVIQGNRPALSGMQRGGR